MKVLSVVGARPQFVKLAPVAAAFQAAGVEHRVIHSGQHYDEAMSGAFFESLHIPAPHYNLGVGSGSHASQTGAIMTAIEPILESEAPDWVLVYGDTNTTLAAAIAATKIHLPLAHLEAGLRSFNRRMPEEHNRILTDHSADVCLAPTALAMEQLSAEGLADRSVLVGDVMIDVLRIVRDGVDSERPTETRYTLATIHRAENTDDPKRLRSIIEALASLPTQVRLPVHPRLAARCAALGVSLDHGALSPLAPMGYPELVRQLAGAQSVVTDSGGLQKEAYFLGVPTVTVRAETEWVETLEGGWNVLCHDPDEIPHLIARPMPSAARGTPFGTGDAAEAVAGALSDRAAT